ncbi:hypothetical protein J1614_007974 [Plenodomus biglobosus]|nr:hypothetical protein J1614_007974 [Plenodomus biglobosus]
MKLTLIPLMFLGLALATPSVNHVARDALGPREAQRGPVPPSHRYRCSDKYCQPGRTTLSSAIAGRDELQSMGGYNIFKSLIVFASG